MSDTRPAANPQSLLDDAWGQVVGGMGWLKSVFFGEFADHRPLSAVVADMLVSFVPGVVIVTSARDAVAVILRLANHPEKREDLMEWVVLSACLIVIALPLAMAAGGAVAAGVGAVVGGIAGTELGAALRAVMLMLIKEASKLVELVQFLQKFIKGDILRFLRAVKFATYEKPLIQALTKISGKLVEIVKTLRIHLESLRYFDSVKSTIAKLTEWEKKFYSVQHDALKQVPKALAELDVRLGKVLSQTAPKEAHTVVAGVAADKTAAKLPPKQLVEDTPGKVLAKVEDEASAATSTGTKPKPKPKTAPAGEHNNPPAPSPKPKPDPVRPPDPAPNTKKQAVVDAVAAADRERITQISGEVREAQQQGDMERALAKKREAWDILRPYVPKNPTETWDEVVKRLDVSSPKDGAVFWSGDPIPAQEFAKKIGGVTLETTNGGRIIDGWDEVNKGMTWAEFAGGPGPYARDLWTGVSEKYAEGATGYINCVQKTSKLRDTVTIWHNVEKPVVQDKLLSGEISGVSMYSFEALDELVPLSNDEIRSLMKIKGTYP